MRARSITILSLLALLAGGLVLCFANGETEPRLGPAAHETLRTRDLTSLAGETERERIDHAAPLGAYGAPIGSRFDFAFHYDSEYSLELLERQRDGMAGTAPQKQRLPLRGHLDMQVAERDERTITLFAQGRNIETPVTGHVDDRGADSLRACRDALQSGFLVRIDPRGTIRGYAFRKGSRVSGRNLVRSVVAAFFHTLAADDARPTWRANGADATGEYVAEFRRLTASPLTVERVKKRYIKVGRQTTVPSHRVEGRSIARFAAATGFLDRVDVSDAMRMDVVEFPSRVRIRIDARFECVATAREEVSVDLADWPLSAGASGADEDFAAESRANEAAKWRARLADTTFDELLDAVRTLVEAGDTRSQAFYSAWERLSFKLRLDGEAVAAARELLLHGALAEDTGSMLLSALGNAGSEEAQDVLLAVYGSDRLEGGWRNAAAVSMFQLRRPTVRVLETVSARLADLRQVGELDATSMLMFGAIASRGEGRLSNGRTAFDQLLALERRAADLGASGLWLDALGNAAVPAVAKPATRYLGHDDAIVRESAVVALDRSSAAGIAATLIPIARRDPARTVRLRAIEALGKRPAATGRAVLRDIAVADRDAGVRRAAVQALASLDRLSAADRAALQRVAQADRNADVRAAATQLLASARS